MIAQVFRPLRCGIGVVALLALGLLEAGCGGGEEEEQQEQAEEEHNIYFGWLLGTSDIVAVALLWSEAAGPP